MAEPHDDDVTDASTAIDVRGVAPHEEPSTRFVLTVIEGPDAGAVLDLGEAADGGLRTLVGSGPACALRLRDPLVSRRHVALETVGKKLRLTDLDSTNGTFVDGVQVMDALLRDGELVRLGATALRVEARGALSPSPEPSRDAFGRYLGASPEMRRLYPLCDRLAASDVPVVIEGETGTGKEVMAEALHEMGPRAAGPYVVLDCTSVAPSLVEAELFGHEKGAFTGATAARKGVFELAEGGTLLIDEIGDLDTALQPKLLRAVERGEIRRVGGARAVKVNVRVIAATRRDLDREVQAGRFRDDLYHRLAVARLELPPLRARAGDVAFLARYFWRQLGGRDEALTGEILARWSAQPWPGNIRELRNTIARHVALGSLAEDPAFRGPSMPAPATPARADLLEEVLAQNLPLPRARERVLAEFERRYVARVLEQHGGDTARAAAASGIARRYFNLIRARRTDRSS